MGNIWCCKKKQKLKVLPQNLGDIKLDDIKSDDNKLGEINDNFSKSSDIEESDARLDSVNEEQKTTQRSDIELWMTKRSKTPNAEVWKLGESIQSLSYTEKYDLETIELI